MKRRRMMMSNLPQELVEEILSRVPLASLKAVRSTCKKWNALTKDQSFTNKHIGNVSTSGEREFLMIKDHKVYLIGFNLHGIQSNNVDLSIKLKGKLNSIDRSHKVFGRSQVFHCNGLLLFVLDTNFVVWNPYYGIPKCIKRPYEHYEREKFALGYDKSCGSHKILRLYGNNLELYDLSSDSWMVPNVILKWDISSITHFGSLKGNSYWYAHDKESSDHFIFSFDFTRKRFGPRLDVPFNGHKVSLSVVKDEQLAMLFSRWDTHEVEIWVTNKIEPDTISWSRFLKINMTPNIRKVDFLIDEEKKVAVVFDRVSLRSRKLGLITWTKIAYIIGENNYSRNVDFGESPNRYISSWPLACPYVPSSVQIK